MLTEGFWVNNERWETFEKMEIALKRVMHVDDPTWYATLLSKQKQSSSWYQSQIPKLVQRKRMCLDDALVCDLDQSERRPRFSIDSTNFRAARSLAKLTDTCQILLTFRIDQTFRSAVGRISNVP